MTKPIRVLYLHHHGSPGGASRSLTYLIRNFPAGAISATVLTVEGMASELFRQVGDVVTLKSGVPEFVSVEGGRQLLLRSLKVFFYLGRLKEIEKAICDINPDIVHLNELSLGLVARVCKKHGYPVVMHARVVLSDDAPLINKLIRHYIRKYVDRIIAIDGSVANKLRLQEKSVVVYNPLHTEKVLQPLTFHRERCHVLFLANLIPYKGIFDLLDAAKQIKDTHVKIFIAGSNSRPPEYMKSLKGRLMRGLGLFQDVEARARQIIENNKLTNVELIGYVSDINQLFGNTDVLIFPSHMNGPSRSVFEAGALGIPSIISLKNVVEDVVVNGKNGIIVPERRPAALASAMRRMAVDTDFRKFLSQNAFTHFNELNNARASARAVLDVYQELLNEGKA